jgi:hypothetical protein
VFGDAVDTSGRAKPELSLIDEEFIAKFRTSKTQDRQIEML